MSNTMSKLMRGIGFVAILAACLLYANSVLSLKAERADNYIYKKEQVCKELPAQSVDVIFDGGSAVWEMFVPTLLFEDTGIRSFNLATPLQPPISLLYNLEDVLAYQSPACLVVDFNNLLKPADPTARDYEQSYWKGYNALYDKGLRRRYLDEWLACDKRLNEMTVRFPLIRFHERWRNLSRDDFMPQEYRSVEYESSWLGSNVLKAKGVAWRRDYMKEKSPAKQAYVQESVAVYDRLIAACKERGIKVVAVLPPRRDTTREWHRLYSEYAQQKGIAFIDFNEPRLWEETGLDAKDFYDESHVGLVGARKLTDFMGAYLVNELGVSSKPFPRADESYRAFSERFNRLYPKKAPGATGQRS